LLRNSGYLAEIGEENVFSFKREAIAAIFARLERERCRHCHARIFHECATVEGPAGRPVRLTFKTTEYST
jgi:hypothetical protein